MREAGKWLLSDARLGVHALWFIWFTGRILGLLKVEPDDNSKHLYCFPCGSAGKDSACSAGDLGSIPGLGTSPGEGKGNPFQYSGLENFMNWIVHGVTKSWTQLNDFHFTSHRNDYAVDHFLCPLHRIFNTITLWVTYSYYPHFTGEDTNDQRSQITCPKLPR